MVPSINLAPSSAVWNGRVKAAVFAIGLVLTTYSAANWWSIFVDHAPPCHPECAADFVTFYATAKLMSGNAASLYDLDQQFAYQKQIAPLRQVLPFVYPPITALLMSPLAWFSFSNAFLLMTLFNLALLWDSIRRLNRTLGLTRDQSQWLLLFTLCNYGVHHVLYQGQTSVIVLYLFTGYVISERLLHKYRGGFWIGLLSVKPQYLPVPNLIFLLQGKWRTLFLSLLFTAVLTVGAFLTIGVDSLWQYFSLVRRMAMVEQDWWNQLSGMHNLRALAIYWLSADWKEYGWWLSSAMVIASICWVNLRARYCSMNFQRLWITNVLGLLLVTPHLFTHDLALLILPCALLLSLFRERVSIPVGLGLISLGLVPITSFVFPTIVALVFLILYIVSLTLCLNETSST
jgi:hypothetical protein